MEKQRERCCPRCGSQLRWVNTIPRFGDRPVVRILQCTNCDEPQLLKVNGYEHGRPR